MINVKEACKRAYDDKLNGLKFTRIKDTGDSFIICFAGKNGERVTANPYRISKENGERLPFVLPSESYFDMFNKAADVPVPEEYALKIERGDS